MQAPAIYSLFAGITFLGSPTFWIMLAASMYWLGREKDSFFFMNLVVFTSALVALFKPLFGIARPETASTATKVVGFELYSGLSFPSGHVTTVTAIFAYWSKWMKKRQKWIAAFIVFLVAFSRLYLQVHWLTDVMAGIVLGYLIGKANSWIAEKMQKKSFRFTEFEDEAAIFVLLVFGMMLLFFLESFGIVGVLIGYYFGFFWMREIGFRQSAVGKREVVPKLLFGYAGAAIPIGLIYLSDLAGNASPWLYLLLGAWISIVYPWLYEGAKVLAIPRRASRAIAKKH